MLLGFEPLQLFFLFFSSFIVCFVLTPIVMRKMKQVGIVGVDVHKTDKPKIPEMGGLSIVFTLIFGSFLSVVLFSEYFGEVMVFLAVVLIAAFVGMIDDLRGLSALLKPFLLVLACIPVILSGLYSPHPAFPFIGKTRLTIIYFVLIPLVVAVPANAANMIDVLNGAMSGTCAIIAGTVLVCSLILDSEVGLLLSLILFASLLAFWYFNRYPARGFAGDTGSLSVGAALGGIAVLGSVEIVVLVAMMPLIMNSFYILASIGGLKERREIERPTYLMPDGYISATENPKAPLTLTRIFLIRRPLKEGEILKGFYLLALVSAVLAIMTALLIP